MAPIMFVFSIIFMLLSLIVTAEENLRKSSLETYIVQVNLPKGRILADSDDRKSWYQSFLPESTADEAAGSGRLLHSYRHVASGFAAKLSTEEVKEMEKIDGFVKARPQKKISLHTTHSPNFLGLFQNSGVWNATNYGEGVIIGVLDTGITSGHLSFDDKDMPPPPAKWKGKCEFNGTAACNNKLIGARNFVSASPGPPLDDEGHGTHTSSTAAGNFVQGANVFGQANGTAAGMAPRAYLAMYKICSADGCAESEVLAGMDSAIDDGVDVLSLSLGAASGVFYADGIAVAAFAAIRKGIFVSTSAGNSGPERFTCSNEAPWILTVGASTIDRNVVATAVLGNKVIYKGESICQPSDFPSDLLPLVDAGAGGDEAAAFCGPGAFDNIDVKGTVVLCKRGGGIGRIEKGQTVKDAGGAAMILMNDNPDANSTIADPHVLPATHVSFDAGDKIKAYINSTKSPIATIVFKGTVIGNPLAPSVASFSSRGPSNASPGILKPDIIGPGVSMLAAWPISVDKYTNEKAHFNMISGTSISCPHLSGIAALIKSTHPDWSPAAIKSAIMTTATQTNLGNGSIVDEKNLPANIFSIGAGHVNPSRANDPGLIYDLQPADYIPYLCGLKYTDDDIQTIVQQPVTCANITSIPGAQLNYPSFAFELSSTSQTLTRTVRNVGEANSRYESVVAFDGSTPVGISVVPSELLFGQVNQTMSYKISFSRKSEPTNLTYVEGALIWRSATRDVRTPISIKLVNY